MNRKTPAGISLYAPPSPRPSPSGSTAIELSELRQDRSADFSPLPAVLAGPERSGLKSALLTSMAVPSGRGRIFRGVLETPELSCSTTIPSANNQDEVTNPAMGKLSERLDGCSLSPRERVRVRGNEAGISSQMSEMETRTALASIPILIESSGFAPRIGIIP